MAHTASIRGAPVARITSAAPFNHADTDNADNDNSAMEQERPLQPAPPPAYTQHEPESLHLPSVPTHLPTHNHHDNARLPGIKSLHLPETKARHTPHNSIEYSPRAHFEAPHWGVLPAPNSATFPSVPEGFSREDMGSPMDTASIRSVPDDTTSRRETSVSMDDPDVRLAAEALSGLGNPGTRGVLMTRVVYRTC